MSNLISSDFFKHIVKDLDVAIAYFVPKTSIRVEAKEFVIAYANKKANIYFSDSEKSIENLTIKEVDKLSRFGNLLIQMEQALKAENQELFRVDFINAKRKGKIKADLKRMNSGFLLSITNIEEVDCKNNTLKSVEANLQARIQELEISNLFSNRVLDSINSIITYVKPIFDKKDALKDFRIVYMSNRMDEVTSENSELIVGKTLFEYYPQNFENGVIEILRECYRTGNNRDYIKEFDFNGQRFWLNSRAIKMNDGLIIFSKDITQEKEYEEQLFIQNRLLSEAESVASIGSFRYTMGRGNFKFSDNLCRMFGLEPDEADSNYYSLFSIVHSHDIEKVKASFKESRINKTKIDLIFRIITKSEDLKYMNALSECYQKDDNWYMVGVIKDVTKQMAAESNLQVKNAQLKKSNSDLEAFNRVASHDLQEPLRKIQMFVSRLNEEEKDRLNPRSLVYLEKVKSSSNRMRNLINNLLSYSKVEELAEQPKNVDLNEVLKNALEDLTERIEEQKAEIYTDKLPVVNGVQFQLEQLFANLIGNSLKYAKPDTTAKIQIKSKVVNAKELPLALRASKSDFIKLQFIDNGIGFEKEYEEKIFEIFQRLHGKNEFSGTGLGLSICKKIVESHNGAIEAKGGLGTGSIFIVYLPVLM